MLREGARPERAWDNMGHGNIDVTQNVSARGLVALVSAIERLKGWAG